MNSAIRTLFLIAVSFFSCWLLRDARLALPHSLDQTLSNATGAIQASVQGLPAAIESVRSASENLGGVIADERKASASQTKEVTKIIAATKEVLVRTDCQLNGGPGCQGVLPEMTSAIEQSRQSLGKLSRSAQQTLQLSSQTLDSLNKRIADDRVDQILANFSTASLHIAGITDNAEGISHDLRIKTDQLVAPQSLKSRIFWTTLDLVKLGGAAAPWFVR